MRKWYNDPIFEGDPSDGKFQLNNFAVPAFRLSLQSHWNQAHPFEYDSEYGRIFSLFEPILRRDAERLLMIEVAGKKPRRRRTIMEDDWKPFINLRSKILTGDDPEKEISEWRFIGFDFQSNPGDKDASGGAATKFFLNIADDIKLDASVPIEDFESGKLNITELKDALLALPAVTAIAGYGMSFPETFDWPPSGEWALKPVAEKFPVLDICMSGNRSWRGAAPVDFKEYWLNGINWLTLVGEPILSRLGGIERITDGLDSKIEWKAGNGTVLFQIGDRPITGEKGRDDDLLPLYFDLGRRLRPLDENYPTISGRTQDPFGHVGDRAHKELNNDWARRFYDQRWFERLS